MRSTLGGSVPCWSLVGDSTTTLNSPKQTAKVWGQPAWSGQWMDAGRIVVQANWTAVLIARSIMPFWWCTSVPLKLIVWLLNVLHKLLWIEHANVNHQRLARFKKTDAVDILYNLRDQPWWYHCSIVPPSFLCCMYHVADVHGLSLIHTDQVTHIFQEASNSTSFRPMNFLGFLLVPGSQHPIFPSWQQAANKARGNITWSHWKLICPRRQCQFNNSFCETGHS